MGVGTCRPAAADDQCEIRHRIVEVTFDIDLADATDCPADSRSLAVAVHIAMTLRFAGVPAGIIDFQADQPFRPAEVEMDQSSSRQLNRALGHGRRQPEALDRLLDAMLEV